MGKPGRYDSTSYNVHHHESIRSVSSLGSAIPFNGSTHQQLLSNADNDASQSYMGSAWTYTVGMLSSIGTIFGGAGNEETQTAQYGQRRNHYNEQHHMMMNMDNAQDDEYDIHTDYPFDDHSRRSSLSNISNYQNANNNQNVYGGYDRHSRRISGSMSLRNKHYAGQPSMAGSYAEPQIHHNRGLSAAVIRAKQKRRNKHHPRHRSKNFSNMSSNSLHQRKWSNLSNAQHQRKVSRHRTHSNMSTLSQHHEMRGLHRSKQPSKQEVLLESTENENIRDSMAKIFDAFDEAQDNVNNNMSQDLSANYGMFSLDDMVKEDQ